MTYQMKFGEDAGLVALRMAWERTLNALEARVNSPVFHSCLKTVKPLMYTDGKVTIGAANQFAKQWIESKLNHSIKELLEDNLGEKITLSVVVSDGEQDTEADAECEGAVLERTVKTGGRSPAAPKYVLNNLFTFDSFVVGPTNRMAFASCCAVAKSPGSAYNPLFIYGESGLGKTHLLHAIGNFVSKVHPGVGMTLTNAEQFTCEYVDAVSNRKTTQFRRRHRDVDIWLVDDIQHLAGKERTREEFFHTYNALHEVGKQIVLTSDRPPKDLQLDDRLLSRFEAGLMVDIAPPDLETRMAIIQSKAEKQELNIPQEVVLYIAQLIRSNIRAIEGALLKLRAYASVMNEPVSTQLATDILEQYYEKPAENLITPEMVQQIVARHFGMEASDLNKASREARVVLARQIAMYLLKQVSRASLPAIGKAFGGKDHTTVLHAVKKISKLVLEDPRIADDIAALTKELRG